MNAKLATLLLAALTAACASTRHDLVTPSETSPAAHAGAQAEEWSLNGTIIEACSCPMFCQCYFSTEPAAHPGCCPPGADPQDAPRYCRFNNAYRVNHGTYGDTRLDGARFWIAGDLGGDFSQGKMNWAILHFDPSVKPAQREGIQAALGALYPVKWESFEVGADLPVEWRADKDRAVARLDGGKAGEVVLKRNQGMSDAPIVIHNLRYWGAPRNDGFVLMQNEVEAYRLSERPYEHRGTNGFMITFDISSKDAPAGEQGKGY